MALNIAQSLHMNEAKYFNWSTNCDVVATLFYHINMLDINWATNKWQVAILLPNFLLA